MEPRTLEVKGSAKKAISSDLIAWSSTLVTRDKNLVAAYDKLKADADKVAAFVKAAGLPEGEITFSSINTNKIYAKEIVPPADQAGQSGSGKLDADVQIAAGAIGRQPLGDPGKPRGTV